MMNALLLDASPSPDDVSARAADALDGALKARGARVDRLVLRTLRIRACTGCFGCWIKRPGECLVDDDARRVAAAIIRSDIVAIAGPVSFGGWNWLAKAALDRCIGLILPFFRNVHGEIHHAPRYERFPRFLALGTMAAPDADAEATFARLVERNAVNMNAPAHAAVVAHGAGPAGKLAADLVAATEGIA